MEYLSIDLGTMDGTEIIFLFLPLTVSFFSREKQRFRSGNVRFLGFYTHKYL
jgi:hypothetical protein